MTGFAILSATLESHLQVSAMIKLTVLTVSGILLIYLAVGSLLYSRQRSYLYFPPPEINDPGIESFHLQSGESRLKVWRLNPGRKNAVIYFGGNAENVWYNIESFRPALSQNTVYLVNYRGYAGSTARPTEQGLYMDGLNVYDNISPAHVSVSIIGRSLGSAVATHVAARRQIEKIALVTPFDSIEQLARENYPLYPVSHLLKDKYLSIKNAGQLRAPVLILIAEHDQIVPHDSTRRLVEAMAKTEVETVVLPGVGHNNLSRLESYAASLGAFFKP